MRKIVFEARPWEILALLRFWLAWIVFCSHVKDFIPAEDHAITFLINFFVNFDGRAAVLGFLLVSGYSIAHSIERKPKAFLQRRVLRIYPLYLTSILVTQVISLFLGSQVNLPTFTFHQTSLATTIGNLFFLQTFACVSLGYNPVVWSLAIEMFYYLLAPVFNRFSAKLLLGLALLSGVFSVFINAIVVDGENTPSWIYFFGTTAFSHLWAWLFGFLYFKVFRHSSGFILMILGILFVGFNRQQFYGDFALFTYIISFLMIIYAGSIRFPTVLSKFSLYLGDLSYPLYLFHLPFLLLSYAVFKVNHFSGLILVVSASTLFFYHLVDVYLKDKYLRQLIKTA